MKIMSEKRKEIKRLSTRSDIQQIMVVTDKDQSRDMKFLTEKFSRKLRGSKSMNELLQNEEILTENICKYEQAVADVLSYVDDYLKTHEEMADLI